MLKYVATHLLFFTVLTSQCQIEDRVNKLYIALGVNLLDNNGDVNPFSIIDEFENIAISNPFEVSLSYGISSDFEVFVTGSLNKFKKGQVIDGRFLRQDYSYRSLDLGLRYYYYELNFSSAKSIDFYAHAGGGSYSITRSQITTNVGLGVVINITNKIGIYFNSSAKFSVENKPFKSNLFQHSFGLNITLFDFDCRCKL